MSDDDEQQMRQAISGSVAVFRAGLDQFVQEWRAAGMDEATVAMHVRESSERAASEIWREWRKRCASMPAFFDRAAPEVFEALASLLGDGWVDTVWRWAEVEFGEVRPS